MKISVILPALSNKGPILVAKDIISNLSGINSDATFYVFYFDEIAEPIEFACPAYWIKEHDHINKLYSSDIVHSHGIRPDFFIFKNRKKFKGKCISTLHGLISKEYSLQFTAFGARLIEFAWISILRRHDNIVVLTEVMKTHYLSYFDLEKLHVINNGRNLSSKMIDQQDIDLFVDLKKKYKVLGVACVLTKRKGIHQVIQALPMLSDYAFVVIGDGEERTSLEKQAESLGVKDRCIFLGNRAEANRYNKFFDYYIFPSYMEGLPLALLEAAGAGKAIICSDINIHREIFSEEEASFFALDNVNDLMRAVLKANLYKTQFEQKVIEVYRAKFTADIMANSYNDLYKSLLK